MQNQRDETCGCSGKLVGNKPLFELRNLIALLERQEDERNSKKETENKT
jgi:hypothetical protein